VPRRTATPQVLNDVSDNWQLLHHELHLGKSPTTAAWQAGQSSNEALAEVRRGHGGMRQMMCVARVEC
jgi:hypothetical protein